MKPTFKLRGHSIHAVSCSYNNNIGIMLFNLIKLIPKCSRIGSIISLIFFMIFKQLMNFINNQNSGAFLSLYAIKHF